MQETKIRIKRLFNILMKSIDKRPKGDYNKFND